MNNSPLLITELQNELKSLKEENQKLSAEIASLRQKPHKELSFKEKYAVKILDSIPDMLSVFDRDEVGIEVVSSEETNHIKLSNSEFKGTQLCDMIPAEAYENVHANMKTVLATGKRSSAYHELYYKGEHRYFENRIMPLDDDYILIMCRDITRRISSQKKLQAFKSVLDKLTDIIVAASSDGDIVYANAQFSKEYNVTSAVETSKIFHLDCSFKTEQEWIERVQQIRNNNGTLTYLASHRPIGESREKVNQVSAFLVPEENKEIIWFFTQDITDVVRKRDEFRELNVLLESILNTIPVYLFVKDPTNDFRYLYWNKAFTTYSNIPASKAIGKTDWEIFPDIKDAEKFRRDDLELLRTQERIDIQESYLSATGEIRTVQTLKILVPMEGREPLLMGVSWDITSFRNVEKELVNARTKAEQSDRLKSAFLANMSHEIRTPLNAIVGFSRLLTTADNSVEEKLYSDIINQNSDILLQLINDILDLSKIEAGTLEYVKRPMNLGEVFRTLHEVHKGRVQEHVSLILDNTEKDDIIINEDNNRMMQVLTNFITNASKFTSSGEIHLGFIPNDAFIECYVQDTGIGISEDKIEKVFDRFVKLNTFAQGTGLGLSICKMIIDKIGGEISATSTIGEGSRFYFTIPYDKTASYEMPPTIKNRPALSPISSSDSQQERTILVAEDVESNFLLLKNIIGSHYKLLWAKDGNEAVAMYKCHNPDLILMDIKMPKKDGLAATKLIRTYSQSIPIIALSAYAFETDKEQALGVGCNDFLTKPVSDTQLLEILNRYLK